MAYGRQLPAISAIVTRKELYNLLNISIHAAVSPYSKTSYLTWHVNCCNFALRDNLY
jgi:hypothetical protein